MQHPETQAEIRSTIPVRERKLSLAAIPAAVFVVLLWCVHLIDHTYQLDLYRFGIRPRVFSGLIGVFASPFIHGDAEHLINNSIPLLVLGWALLYFFPRVAGRVVLGSWVVSGFWVWLSARGSYHIGASGVVYGLAAFLFVSGLLRRQRTLMGLSLLVVFLYGGLLWGVFPIVPRISWESHFWGAAAGVIMAFLYRDVPSAVNDPKPILWDDDEDATASGPLQEPGVPSEEEDVQGARSWRSTDTWNIKTEGTDGTRSPNG